MAMCEMCGAEDRLFRADIEGTILQVCSRCGRHGKLLAEVRAPVQQKKQKVQQRPSTELVQVIVPDYAVRIKARREGLGLKQEELAKSLAERVSLVQKLESGQFKPSLSLARKLERFLKVQLVEQHEEKHELKFRASSPSLTIGDVITMKKG